MRNTAIVIKYEIVSMLRKPSFWFFTVLFPVMIMAFTFVPTIFAQQSVSEAKSALADVSRGPSVPFVDEAGIIVDVPDDMRFMFRSYPDRHAAESALAAGDIQHYFLIPSDARDTGRIYAVNDRPSLITGITGSGPLEYVLRSNLAGGGALGAAIADPDRSVEVFNLKPAEAAEGAGAGSGQGDEMTRFLVPFGVMFILFFVITMSAGYMLQSVTREKENRTAELLLTSLRPRELMLGKVVGLGIVAFVQMAIWLGGGQLVLARGSVVPSGLFAAALNAEFFAWAVVFFIFGYIVYAAALGALGALAPNMREGSQFTFVMLLPLLIPLWLNNVFSNDPNGPIATALSLFPLSAPTAMVTRLVSGEVPVWQPFAAIAGLVVTAYLFVMLAARFFRADTLLSGASISWGRIAREIKGGG